MFNIKYSKTVSSTPIPKTNLAEIWAEFTVEKSKSQISIRQMQQRGLSCLVYDLGPLTTETKEVGCGLHHATPFVDSYNAWVKMVGEGATLLALIHFVVDAKTKQIKTVNAPSLVDKTLLFIRSADPKIPDFYSPETLKRLMKTFPEGLTKPKAKRKRPTPRPPEPTTEPEDEEIIQLQEQEEQALEG